MFPLERDDPGDTENRASHVSPLDNAADLPGCRLGWQAWTVRDGGLVSIGETEFWPVGRARVARCFTRRHVAPAPGCRCGLAAHDEAAMAVLASRWSAIPMVIGCVALWGGFDGQSTVRPGGRAKRAYPVLLIGNKATTPAQRRALGASYDVPVYAGAADTVAALADPVLRMHWQYLRNRLELSLRGRSGDRDAGRPIRTVVAGAVDAWSAAPAPHDDHRRTAIAAPHGSERPEPSSSGIVPDIAGLVVAWRTWQLTGSQLSSVTRPDAWPGQRPMVGSCAANRVHPAPAASCTCGIYAAREIAYAGQYHWAGHGSSVMGCVGLWGRLVEAEFGWRAEKAYPLVLLAPSDVSTHARRVLERTYDVPVVPISSAADPAWDNPSTGSAAERLRAALEETHGRIEGPVTAALAAMTASARSVHPPSTAPRAIPPPRPAPVSMAPRPPVTPRARVSSVAPVAVTAGGWTPVILWCIVVATTIALLLIKLLS